MKKQGYLSEKYLRSLLLEIQMLARHVSHTGCAILSAMWYEYPQMKSFHGYLVHRTLLILDFRYEQCV